MPSESITFRLTNYATTNTARFARHFLQNPFGTTYTKAKPGWDSDSDLTFKRIGIPLWVGALIFLLWACVLAGCLIIRASEEGEKGGFLALFETMFRVGSIIFGGGQVVLPMLYGEVRNKLIRSVL